MRRDPDFVSLRDLESGSAVISFLAVVAAAVLAVAGVAHLGGEAVASGRARTAADAAALGAAIGDRSLAAAVATANGGSLEGIGVSGQDFTATVSIDGQVANATARRESLDPATGSRAGLAPAMLAALARAEELLGVEVPIVSGYRSPEHQQRLWDNRHNNPYPVARPGTSRHELGLAIDVPLHFVPTLRRVVGVSGLCHPLPVDDPVHFIVCPNLR